MAIERAQQPAYTSGAAASAAAEAEYLRDQNKPDEAQLATLNSEFDSQGTNNSYWDSVYNQYTEQHGSAVEKNNMEEAARLNAEYTALMDRKDYFDNVTLESMYEDQSEQWTWDEIKYNDQLINSLRRSNGAYNEYGEEVLKLLKNYDIRGLVDQRNEKIGRKIRDAEVNKIPFMLIIGEKESSEKCVSVRQQGKGDLGTFKIDEFAQIIKKEIDDKLIQFEN